MSAEIPAGTSAGDALEAIAEVWRNLLGVSSVSHSDEFFSLGGSSILLMVMLDAVQTKLGRQIDLELLTTDITVDSVAAHLEPLQ